MIGLRGGQWWVQPEFPCCRRYVVYMPTPGGSTDEWAIIHDPREQGNITCSVEIDGEWRTTFTGAELLSHFERCSYENRGQFSDILSEERERLYEAVA